MNWIVTGGAGFIGSAFLARLNQEGIANALVVDDLGESDKWKNLCGKQFRDVVGVAEFRRAVETGSLQHFGAVTHVCHMGACSYTTVRNADYLLENNYRITRLLAEACVSSGVYLQYASSAATYGDGDQGFVDDESKIGSLRPQNMYGYSKQLVDEWALRSGAIQKITGIKFFNVFGPNEYHKGDQRSLLSKAYLQAVTTGKIQLFKSYHPQYGHGESTRDFVYIKDCVEVLWWLSQHPEVTGIFNLGTGKDRSWNDLASAVFQALNLRTQIEYVEMPEGMRDRYQYFTCAPMQKLADTGCPLHFRTLEESVADYVHHYLAKGSAIL